MVTRDEGRRELVLNTHKEVLALSRETLNLFASTRWHRFHRDFRAGVCPASLAALCVRSQFLPFAWLLFHIDRGVRSRPLGTPLAMGGVGQWPFSCSLWSGTAWAAGPWQGLMTLCVHRWLDFLGWKKVPGGGRVSS